MVTSVRSVQSADPEQQVLMSPAEVRQTSPDALQAAAAETLKISYKHSTALADLLIGAWVVVAVQENPAMSWHTQDPQLVLNNPQVASQVSVHSLALHLSPHCCFAVAQQRVLKMEKKMMNDITCMKRNTDVLKQSIY